MKFSMKNIGSAILGAVVGFSFTARDADPFSMIGRWSWITTPRAILLYGIVGLLGLFAPSYLASVGVDNLPSFLVYGLGAMFMGVAVKLWIEGGFAVGE